MGRFFNAPQVELAKDNMYAPPFEMMAAALSKKDADIQQQADTMELLRSLPIDYLDYHKQGATDIKNEIGSQVDELAKKLQENLLSPENKSQLNTLKRKIEDRYTSGDIYNIQQSSKNFKEFEKKLEADKDMTPALKQKHIEGYWNDYATQNPDGGYKNVYTPGPVVGDVDGLKQYTDWFTKLKPDEKKNIVEKLGGRYDTMTETERNKMVLENGFETFVEATPELKDAYLQQGKSKLFSDRNLMEGDKLNYKSGYLSDVVKAAKELNYTQTLDSKKYDTNDYNFREEDWAHTKALKKEEDKVAAMMEVNVDGAKQYEASMGAVIANQNMVNDINKRFETKGFKYKIDRLEDLLSIPNAQKAFPEMYKKVKAKIDDTKSKMDANWNYAYNFTDTKGVEQMKKQFEEKVIANQRDIKVNIPNTTFKKYNPTTKQYELQDVTTMKNDNVGIKEFVGTKMLAPNGKWVLIDGASIVPNSTTPMFLNNYQTGEQNLNNNDALTSVQFQYLDGETTRTFTRPANFFMETNVGVMTK